MTEYKLNTLIEWTDEDRAKGECPVPKGSVVTVWFSHEVVVYTESPEDWRWDYCTTYITAYLIHSVPREPIVRWVVIGGVNNGLCYCSETSALLDVAAWGGRVVKMVEEV